MADITTEINTLLKNINGGVNRLIRENDQRISNDGLNPDDIQFVPFADFEAEATKRLGITHGWKQEFEKQLCFISARSTVMWNQQGKVPYGVFALCRMLTPVKAKTRSVPWSDEEKNTLRSLHASGLTYRQIASEMNKLFPDIRQYEEGAISGAIRTNIRKPTT